MNVRNDGKKVYDETKQRIESSRKFQKKPVQGICDTHIGVSNLKE